MTPAEWHHNTPVSVGKWVPWSAEEVERYRRAHGVTVQAAERVEVYPGGRVVCVVVIREVRG